VLALPTLRGSHSLQSCECEAFASYEHFELTSSLPAIRLMSEYDVFILHMPGFEPRSGHVGFVVEKVALGQVFSEYFGFPCQFSFHRLFHSHHHLSYGAATVGQIVADVPSGLSLTPPHPKKLEKRQSYTPPSCKTRITEFNLK
jgi:hypothetical protein